ncbi:TCEA1 [Symbiodinium natans]|uniref:TCEA1 protein n=1 Tax=Symbiodinium natans TaxID=878477 RepID=A0A812J918_9DINO|nr:TCEA1 [Symbiodinium natans]
MDEPTASTANDAGDEGDKARLMQEVQRLKGYLQDASTAKETVISTLDQLQKLGSLSIRVLGETMVGRAVHDVGRDAVDPEIRKRARSLEAFWRNEYKKRKSTSVGDDLLLKRRLSSDVSEVTATPTSQELDSAKDAGSAFAGSESGVAEAPRALDRANSTLSSSSQVGDKKDDAYREKVRMKLIEALGKEEEIEAKGGESQKTSTMRDPVKLAEEIEEELHKVWPAKKDAYMNQARSILFNLKDAKNPTFRFKVVVGFFQPKDLPKLTAEDMASDEKNAERAKQRQYAMEALDQGWALKNGQQLTTGMFTCGKCKGNKTTYFQMQTRSSDEPMTTFVTCLTCGNRWKFC